MNYKKKYEKLVDAVKVLRDNNPSDEGIHNWVNDNVPELKGSEDERIKTAILNYLKKMWGNCQDDVCGIHVEDAIAWLEKQGEKDKLIHELCEYKVKYIQETLEKALTMNNKDDERVRKTTIAFLKDFADKGYENAVECIDWLEKQGKETNWKPSKEEMDVLYGLAYITNKYDEHKEEVITRLYQDLKREFFNGSSYENMFPNTENGVRRRSTIQVLEYARSLDNFNQYGKADIDKNIAWLEKQDNFSNKDVDDAYLKGVADTKNEIEKQYEANYQIRKDIATFIFNYKGDIKDRAKWMNYLGIKVSFVEKQGEKPQGKSAREAIQKEKVDNQNCIKPADKIGTKFKVGDWITNGHYTWKVISVDNFDYTLQNQRGECVEDTIDYVDKAFHLWTIQDAKDGDVLSFYSEYRGNKMMQVGIVKEYVGKHGGCSNTFSVYAGMNWENNLQFGKYMGCSNISNILPATKERRELLFQKMKEAGYKWDSEKKELRKEEVK